jgi:anti-sigma B factor antagonist
MSEGKIVMTRNGKIGVIKVIGVGSFQQAVAFKSTYLDLLGDGVMDFVIDLSQCEQLDSTFLGIILGMALKVRQKGTGLVHVIHANEMIRSLFRGTGLDQIFDMRHPGAPPAQDPAI